MKNKLLLQIFFESKPYRILSHIKSLRIFLTILGLIIACVLYARNYVPSPNLWTEGQEDTLRSSEDSIKEAQRLADSIASFRTYMKSKRYNDSIDAWRKARMDSIRAENQRKVDSTIAERKRVTDSANQERIRINDSLQAAIAQKQLEQKRQLDSLNVIRQITIDSLNELKAYRNSKRFKDSVSQAQKQVIDSIKAERKAAMDSLISERRAQMDSLKLDRERRNDSLVAYLDSMKVVREKMVDSLKQVHQARMDSLEQVKEARLDEMDAKLKEQKDKKNKREKEKIQKQRDAYSNEQMLKKKWSWLRRMYHNTTTRYNYYFNANNKIKEAESNLYRAKVDDLDKRIDLHVYNPNNDSNLLKNDMDSLIQRTGVGIQIHDPRAKWQDDLYLLLGKAFYYKGDYTNAAASFQFIVASAIQEEKAKEKNKKKEVKDIISKEKKSWFHHTPVKNDAILWLARVYIHQGELDAAQILLDMVQSSKNLSDRIKGELEDCWATFYTKQGMYDKALPYLDSMTYRSSLDNRLKARAGFLAAQIYQEKKEFDNASRLYTKIIKYHPPLEMDFKASLNNLIAQSQDPSNNAIIPSLKKMSKESKYKTYYDQIFYSLGQAQKRNGEIDNAIESFQSAIDNGANNPSQKGKSFLTLGDLYYDNKNFTSAKSAYDSAAIFLTAADAPYYDKATAKANTLAAIAGPAIIVNGIDSLLELASMTPRQQEEVAKRALKQIKLDQHRQAKQNGGKNVSNTAANLGGGTWYFADESNAAKGELEFKSKWGNRTLRDNWRRSSSSALASTGSDNNFDDQIIEEEELTVDDLLAYIPKDPKVLDSLKQVLEQSYYELGKAYFSADEYDNAINIYEELLQKYPNFDKQDEILYDRYLIALKRNDIQNAHSIKEQLMSEFPNSARSITLKNASNNLSASNTMNDDGINQHLDQTYQLLQAKQFKEVIVRYEEVKSIYPVQSPRFMDRYALMRAIAFAGLGNYNKADTLLTEIININSNDSLTKWAQSVHEFIKSNMPLSPAVTEGGTDLGNSTSFLDPTALNQTYSYNKDEIHYVLFHTKKTDGRFMGLRAGITDYNSLKNSEMGLKSSLSDLGTGETIFIFKDFDNAASARKYMNDIKREKDLFSAFGSSSEINISIISANNYTLLLLKKNILEYLEFFNKNYR